MVRAVGPGAPARIDRHVPGPVLHLLGKNAELVTRRAEEQHRNSVPPAAAGLLDPGAHRILPPVFVRLLPDIRPGMPGGLHVPQQRGHGRPEDR
jgi:hypothetical protein